MSAGLAALLGFLGGAAVMFLVCVHITGKVTLATLKALNDNPGRLRTLLKGLTIQ